MANVGDFVEMDAERSVKLCEQWLAKDYNKVAKALKDQNLKEQAFNFMSTVIAQNEERIIQECEKAGAATGYKPSAPLA